MGRHIFWSYCGWGKRRRLDVVRTVWQSWDGKVGRARTVLTLVGWCVCRMNRWLPFRRLYRYWVAGIDTAEGIEMSWVVFFFFKRVEAHKIRCIQT